jgi:hypothetical protein
VRYCHFPEAYDAAPLQIEHIISRQHRGQTTTENLAIACVRCNLHKGPNLSGLDPESGALVRLYHPRSDHWAEHFELKGAEVVGRTPIGRATVLLLAMNDGVRLETRANLIELGLFPGT